MQIKKIKILSPTRKKNLIEENKFYICKKLLN